MAKRGKKQRVEESVESVEELDFDPANPYAGSGAAPALSAKAEEALVMIRGLDAKTATASQVTVTAKRALKRDPGCLEAHVLLADVCPDAGKAIPHFRRAVALGIEKLGAKFDACRGSEPEEPGLWFFEEAQTLLNVWFTLGVVYEVAGRFDDAIEVYEGILDVNAQDNQDTRVNLLRCYFLVKEEDKRGVLLERYTEETSLLWRFSRAFHGFLSDVAVDDRWRERIELVIEGGVIRARTLDSEQCGTFVEDLPAEFGGAREMMIESLRACPYMAALLQGWNAVRQMPEPKEFYEDSPDEALSYVQEFGEIWAMHPESFPWVLGCAEVVGNKYSEEVDAVFKAQAGDLERVFGAMEGES